LQMISLGLAAALLLMVGCASVVPGELRKEVDRSISFEELRINPDAYVGRTVLLGGEVVDTKNLPDQTELEVLELPLDASDAPIDADESGGRFLVSYSGYLDPAVYSGGRYVTVVGEVLGAESLKIGGAEHQAPVLSGRFLHLWPKGFRYHEPSYYGPYDYPYGYPYYPYAGFYLSWSLYNFYPFWEPSWDHGYRHGRDRKD
jgi:outer membrane lipoprotein